MFRRNTLSQSRQFSKVYKNYVNGQWTASTATSHIDIISPLDQSVLGRVPKTPEAEFNEIVANSVDVFEQWKEVSLPNRARFMLKYQQLLKDNKDDISAMITHEHGKSLLDAQGDVFRGYEVVEHSCSLTSIGMGETMENVARNVDIYSYRVPLGVCAGICPFNFPAMIPLWMYPLAITMGNTFVLKPSEKVAGTTDILIDLLEQSGVPKGVVNVVQGGPETVTHICEHPDIKAVSFVGGNQAGEYIYKTASNTGKRAQVNMGAKNHAVVMPDADKEDAINAMIGACFGSAGQRCMAISVGVMVGESADWIPEIVEKTKGLTIGAGKDNLDISPMITKMSCEKAHKIIGDSEAMGAKVLLDGRRPTVAGYPDGNWLGATVIECTGKGIPAYDDEIFAPVMVLVKVGTLDEAIELINSHEFGNGVCIFTRSGGHARKLQHKIEAGQIGINLPIPVPLPMFSFTGNKRSMWGTNNFYGKGAVQFYSQWKTVTARWKEDNEEATKMQTHFPTMK